MKAGEGTWRTVGDDFGGCGEAELRGKEGAELRGKEGAVPRTSALWRAKAGFMGGGLKPPPRMTGRNPPRCCGGIMPMCGDCMCGDCMCGGGSGVLLDSCCPGLAIMFIIPTSGFAAPAGGPWREWC